MKKYEITMRFSYTIETDDIERTMNEFEFPVFPYPEDENKVKFLDNLNEWVEVND